MIEISQQISILFDKTASLQIESWKTFELNGVDIYENLLNAEDALKQGPVWGNVGYFLGLAAKEVLGTEESFQQLSKEWPLKDEFFPTIF